MKHESSPWPPRIAQWILGAIHSDRGQFTHLGDFYEEFADIASRRGLPAAQAWYWFQALASLPGLVANKIYWSYAMFRNYFTIACRNLLKNRWFSLINITGLAVGMACFLLILVFVRFELSFDRFHEKTDRIFRVIGRETGAGGGAAEFFANSPDVMAPALTAEFPEIVSATRIMSFWDKVVLQSEGNNFLESGLFADESFLRIFSFPLLEKGPAVPLAASGSIVITEKLARKLFGSADPLGRAINFKASSKQYDLTVDGVLKDIPQNSHLQFDYLISIETMRADKSNSYMFNTWDVVNFITYAELVDPGARRSVEAKFAAFFAKHSPEEARGVQLDLQPLKDIHLKSRVRGDLPSNYEIRYVTLFSSIAFILLLVACINYTNLTTARSTTRAREIGIRKVTGAYRGQLFKQFIGESMLGAFLAMALALLIARAFFPRFQVLIGAELSLRDLQSPGLIFSVIGTVLFVGVISGVYPALVLSSLAPVRALREFGNTGRKGSRLRNGLVVLQFCASVVLLIGTVVILRQMNFVRNERLGFDRTRIVVMTARERQTRQMTDVLKADLLKLPEVEGVTTSQELPTTIRSRINNVRIKNDNGEEVRSNLFFTYVDEDFLDVFRIEIAQGRNFSREFGTDQEAVLINETAVKAAGWKEPVGKEIPARFRPNIKSFKVIGVVKDFHFSSLHSQIEPLALVPGGGGSISVRIRTSDVPRTVALLKKTFEARIKSQPFEFRFMDDIYNQLYQKEIRTGEIFTLFAALTLFIACLGLSGLTAFAVARRTKEIGVRKVLGASLPDILTLLSKEFAAKVALANLIAWLIAYYAMNRWLQSFAYRIGLSPWIFVLTTAGTFFIAFATISLHAIKAASINPSDTLRYE